MKINSLKTMLFGLMLILIGGIIFNSAPLFQSLLGYVISIGVGFLVLGLLIGILGFIQRD